MSGAPAATTGLWVVIPAYNEGTTVREVAARARRHCANIVVVDDGSTDGTGEALGGLDVVVLTNAQNSGKAHSLWRGFQHALAHGAAAVITLDADGQHAPEEIPSFVRAMSADPKALIIGARPRQQRRHSPWRYFANCLADFWISWAAGEALKDSQSGFRLYPAGLLRTLSLKHGRNRSFVFESEVLIEAARRGEHCVHIPITVASRKGPRASHFKPVLDIARITKTVAWHILRRGLCLQDVAAFLRSSPSRKTIESAGTTQQRTV